jgi:hypothetical protein
VSRERLSRLLVAAVLALAAAAAADTLRGTGPERRPAAKGAGRPAPRLVRAPALPFATDGPFQHTRVVFGGREYLSAEAIDGAFPVPVDGPLHISRLSVAPDGTLALGVYRFPAQGPARGAIELWHRRELVSAFPVPPGSFGGGLAVSHDARYVATFWYDGRLRGVFDRTGRRLAEAPESFLYVE